MAIVMTEAEMNGYLTDWLVREHVAELRSQATRRYWRVERKRSRAEVGTAASAIDVGRGPATAVHSTEVDDPTEVGDSTVVGDPTEVGDPTAAGQSIEVAAYRRHAVAAGHRAPSI